MTADYLKATYWVPGNDLVKLFREHGIEAYQPKDQAGVLRVSRNQTLPAVTLKILKSNLKRPQFVKVGDAQAIECEDYPVVGYILLDEMNRGLAICLDDIRRLELIGGSYHAYRSRLENVYSFASKVRRGLYDPEEEGKPYRYKA